MKEILWFLGGVFHSLLHPDSSFFTLRAAGYSSFSSILFIALSNSTWMCILYYLNRLGLNFTLVRAKGLSLKIRQFSSGVVGRYGYAGVIFICFVPYLPYMRETALLTGQILQLKYTLPVVMVANILRVSILSLLTF